jgi:hypothetical protein
MIGPAHAEIGRHGKVAYAVWVRRALAGERFVFPVALTAPALTHQSQPLTGEERADAQRWALELSQIADPAVRQATLATAPAHWQPAIRRYLAWRLGVAALRAMLRSTEPSVRATPSLERR